MSDERIRQLMGKKLARLRKQAGFRSQNQLAAAVEIHQTMISQIETGRLSIPEERMAQFTKVLNVPESELRPGSLGQRYVSGSVQSKDDLSDWREMVIQDNGLEWQTQIVLLSLSVPPLMIKDRWIITATIEQVIRETGRPAEVGSSSRRTGKRCLIVGM